MEICRKNFVQSPKKWISSFSNEYFMSFFVEDSIANGFQSFKRYQKGKIIWWVSMLNLEILLPKIFFQA